MRYYKNINPKYREEISTDNEALVKDLRLQIASLKEQLKSSKQVGYTADEFNDALVDEIQKAAITIRKEFESEINTLKTSLKAKEEVIEALKLSISSGAVVQDITSTVDGSRPVIEDNIFINPEISGDGLTSHIKVEEKKDSKNINSQISKLKDILGKN